MRGRESGSESDLEEEDKESSSSKMASAVTADRLPALAGVMGAADVDTLVGGLQTLQVVAPRIGPFQSGSTTLAVMPLKVS